MFNSIYIKTFYYVVLLEIVFELCCKGSLLQNANIALPGSSTLTVPGSPASGGAQNIYMVCVLPFCADSL